MWGVNRPALALTTHFCVMPRCDINLCGFCTPAGHWILFQLIGIRDSYLQALDTLVTGEWCRRVAGGRWLHLQRSVRSVFVNLSNTNVEEHSWMRLEFSVGIAVMDRPEGRGWRLLWKVSSYHATWRAFGRFVSKASSLWDLNVLLSNLIMRWYGWVRDCFASEFVCGSC
jgi:hypothetical protein